MFSIHVDASAARPAKKRRTSCTDSLKSAFSEIEEIEEEIEYTLKSIASRFRQIKKHVAASKKDFDTEEECGDILASAKRDFGLLSELKTQLDETNTSHPYCPGCNDPYGFQPNQQAHMGDGGCLDACDSSDEDDDDD